MKLVTTAIMLALAAALPGSPASAAAERPGQSAPQFAIYHLNQTSAGEPSLGIDWRNGTILYRGPGTTLAITIDGAGVAHVTDRPGKFTVTNLDPIMAVDHTTGLVLSGGDDGACGMMDRSTDDGVTWLPSEACVGSWDHPTVGIGPYAATPAPINAAFPKIAYYCQQEGGATGIDECARTIDGGASWSPSTEVQGGCVALFGHVKVSTDGTAYLPNHTCYANQAYGTYMDAVPGNAWITGQTGPIAFPSLVGGGITTDNGTTWNSYTIPGAISPARGFDPGVTTTPDNTVYESWARNGDYHPVVAWSHDHATTWSAPIDLAQTTSPSLTASTFQTMVAGDNGRVAVAYLASSVPVPSGLTPYDAGYHGIWYLYVSETQDGGRTWTTSRASQTAVQLGYICDQGINCSAGRNLLDFMDVSVTSDGRVVVGFADGCDGCKNEAHSDKNDAEIAYQTAGPRLFATTQTVSSMQTGAAPAPAPTWVIWGRREQRLS